MKLKSVLLLVLLAAISLAGLSINAETGEENSMNYIYFNNQGRLKNYHFDDLVQGSGNADKVYMFTDYTTPHDYTATMMFRRPDGQEIGEITLLAETAVTNPITSTAMNCHSILLGADVLEIAGSLKITARYYQSIDIDADGIVDSVVKAFGMVAAEISPAVMTGGGTSTAMLNLSSRITALKATVDAYIAGETARAADYAHSLEIDTDNNLLLKNEAGTVLSTENLPLTASAADYGTLVFSGTGAYAFGSAKNYVLAVIGSPTVYVDIYKANVSGETGVITYTRMTNYLKTYTANHVISNVFNASVANDPFDGTYIVSGTLTVDGTDDAYSSVEYLNFGMIGENCYPVLAFISAGYYQVYEMAA